MDRRETVKLCEPHVLNDRSGHRLTVQRGKLLDDLHVVEVVLQIISFNISKLLGSIQRCHKALLQLPQAAFDLTRAPFRLVMLDQLPAALVRYPVHTLPAEAAVILCSLNTEIAAA